jgi:hypothetical protein
MSQSTPEARALSLRPEHSSLGQRLGMSADSRLLLVGAERECAPGYVGSRGVRKTVSSHGGSGAGAAANGSLRSRP